MFASLSHQSGATKKYEQKWTTIHSIKENVHYNLGLDQGLDRWERHSAHVHWPDGLVLCRHNLDQEGA